MKKQKAYRIAALLSAIGLCFYGMLTAVADTQTPSLAVNEQEKLATGANNAANATVIAYADWLKQYPNAKQVSAKLTVDVRHPKSATGVAV